MIRSAVLCALLLPCGAQAEAVPAADIATAHLLPGWRTRDGTRMAALALDLAPGWHTYWRAPGDAGIPPRFDWSGSQNARSVEVLWPAPRAFRDGGLTVIGYDGRLVLPLAVRPAGGGAVALTGRVEIGVCRDICVPVTLDVETVLGDGMAPDPVIRAAMAARPARGPEARCTVVPIADGVRLTARLALPPVAADEVAAVETDDPSVWASEPSLARQGNELTLTADLVPASGAPFALDRSGITLTLLGTDAGGGAVEIRGCPAG